MSELNKSMIRSVKLWELQWSEAKKMDPDRTIVLLPVGAIEQHGLHLPLNTDISNALEFAVDVAERARNEMSNGVVLVAPPIWWGISPHHMSYPGTISLQINTMSQLITDICRSLIHHGFYRILIINGHGGNAGFLTTLVHQMREELGVSIAYATYWLFGSVREVLKEILESDLGGTGHACEMETSLQMFFHPENVDVTQIVRDMPVPHTSYTTIDFREPGPVTFPLDFARDSKTGTMGDPTSSSAEKGRKITETVESNLIRLAKELLLIPPEIVFPKIGEYQFTIRSKA